MFKVALQPRVTKAASFTGTAFGTRRRLVGFTELVVTLNVFSAERDSANETYDFYVWTQDRDNIASWDMVHFPQIATTGAKTFTARIQLDQTPPFINVTTAVPGVAANDPAILQTDAGGTQRIKQLGAGLLRHGPMLEKINYDLVAAGTIATGIDFSIQLQFQ